MAKAYIKAEEKVINIFAPGTNFTFKSENYTTELAQKPKTNTLGDCKTDVYILAKSNRNSEKIDLKISIKKNNADFLENKMRANRAKVIFGDNYKSTIESLTTSVAKDFEEANLIYFDKKGNTNPCSITLGWRFEVINSKDASRSGLLNFTNKQLLEVYSGPKLEEKKRNAEIDGKIVENSGVAEFMLKPDTLITNSAQDVIDNLTPISQYITNTKVYFVCKALNYRVLPSYNFKIEGNRSMSVYVDWKIKKKFCFFGRKYLSGKLIFNDPLEKKGNFLASKLAGCLAELEITKSNFDRLEHRLSKNVKTYRKKP